MSKRIAILVMLVWGAVLRLDAAAAKERPIQFALTGTVSLGSDFEGEMGGHLGPGVRIDLALSKDVMITSEAMYILYWHSIAPAVSLNLRIGKRAYVGAGPLVTWATFDGSPVTALKARLGWKAGHVLFEFHYVTAKASSHTWGGSPRLLGLTFGFWF